ncbi:MAG: O-antigen ligase family protein [Patescibacteria group bacterium]
MLRIVKYLLFAVVLTPLLTLNLPFGTIVWKVLFLRGVLELALIFFCVGIFRGEKPEIKFPWRNPAILLLGAYTVSLVVSTLFAFSRYRALWGNLERGEGLVTWFHYIVFFVLALLVWKKDDLHRMFRFSLVVGVVLIFYGALQYFKVTYFPPFRIALAERVVSLVGNSAFFATHLIFLIIFACLARLHANKTKSRFWEWFSVGFIPLAVLGVFMSGTRGAMLGLLSGGVAFLAYVCVANIKKPERTEKRKAFWAGILLVLIFLGGTFFVATSRASFWKLIPHAERITAPLAEGIKGTSAETRLITWKMGVNAWKERPFFGWGPENHLPALTTYFEPRLDKGGETWFDRSHNNLLDIMVTQGILGLILYIGFMGVLLWFARGNAYLFAGLVAYIVQNLVLFDQPLSYTHLMLLVGFLVVSRMENKEQITEKNGRVIRGFVLGAAAFAAYGLYAWNITPFLQIRFVEAAKKTPYDTEVLRLLKKGFEPYNFAQHDLRASLIDHEYDFQPELFTHPELTELSSFLLESIREARRIDPADSRMLVREIQVLMLQAQLQPELLPEVERVAREGLELAPRKPVFYYKLALALANEEKYDEAKEVAEKAIALYPKAAKSHFQLGLVLAMGGDPYHEEAVDAFQRFDELDSNLEVLGKEGNNYALVYTIWGDDAKVAEIVWRLVSRGLGRDLHLPYMRSALGHFLEKEDKEKFLGVARFMAPLFPDIAEDLKIYIDLAEDEKWEVIRNLQ